MAALLGMVLFGQLQAQDQGLPPAPGFSVSDAPPLPPGATRLPLNGAPAPGGIPGPSGFPGGGGLPGAGGLPGMGAMPGGGGLPGGSGLPGMGAMPGAGGLPGMGGIPGVGGKANNPTGMLGGGLSSGLMGGGLSPTSPFSPLAMAFPPLMMYQLLKSNSALAPGGDGVGRLFPQTDRFRTYGWFDGGAVWNSTRPDSGFNGPYNAVDLDGVMFNQAYIVAEMKRQPNADFGIGGRVDLLYGNDYFLAQSSGFDTRLNSEGDYGVAIPQAYIDLGNDEFSVQIGHFYTLVGYEGIPSPNNFFYSHAYSYQFAGPFTEWGALASWRPSSNWELQAGPVDGWNALDAAQSHINFLGKVKYASDDKNWWSSFAIITGNMPNNPAGLLGVIPDNANRTRYSFLVDRKLTSNLEYVFHQWLGVQQSGTASGSTANWYGIDQYLFYTVNTKWKVGGRVEWFRDEEGTRVGLNQPDNPNKPPLPGNFVSLTVGPNYSPSPNLIVRPELRYDTYDGAARPYDDGRKTQQLMLGIDMIMKF